MKLEDLPELHEGDEVSLIIKSTVDVTRTIPIIGITTKTSKGFYQTQGTDDILGPFIALTKYEPGDWRGDTVPSRMYGMEQVTSLTKI